MSAATERNYRDWPAEAITLEKNKHGVYSLDNPYYTIEQDEAMAQAELFEPRGAFPWIELTLCLACTLVTMGAIVYAIRVIIG